LPLHENATLAAAVVVATAGRHSHGRRSIAAHDADGCGAGRA